MPRYLRDEPRRFTHLENSTIDFASDLLGGRFGRLAKLGRSKQRPYAASIAVVSAILSARCAYLILGCSGALAELRQGFENL
jgi:hypothetical protein